MTKRPPARPIALPAAFHARLLAAVLAGAAMAPAAAQYTEPVLGRLFTAPDERMRLDRDRASAPVATATAAEPAQQQPPPPVAEAPPPPVPSRLTGVIRRSDGRATVWIDGEPRETTLGRYRPGSAIPVETPGGRVLVKPGENIGTNDGAPPDAR
ncbi:hypothetical protein [Pseudoduganella albidiflava]|uniref:Type II secretion system protein GspC N-terminal domain-containing protein n=1 Tax=Pseudoduganella albidiflava TaxID=321983 RepID=A0ABX5RVU0_9BURK|nr:hypothetical protein [Pseudoduganella albidiflava]QBI01925.1 hypothetical protein EYF70_14475 [Pseudoduganella albidiflava]